jgi:poly-gamma-glutamate synthesis protein (capsule biosynthesis protein)
MDYRVEGLDQTVRLLRENGIYSLGAGRNLDKADKELIIECKGQKIAFLAYTSDETFVGAVIATEDQAGSASFFNLEQITEKVNGLRSITDIICISMHWGREHFVYPSLAQVSVAHALVEAGADFIIGHHPHVVQGIEHYKGAVIAYSLGNFYLPPFRSISGRLEPRKAEAKEFSILKSTIDHSGNATNEIIGGLMEKDFSLKPYDEIEQVNFTNKIKVMSEPFYNIDYEEFWQRYKLRRDKELERDALLEAVKKLVNTPLKELYKTISFADVKRNTMRLWRIISRLIYSSENKI